MLESRCDQPEAWVSVMTWVGSTSTTSSSTSVSGAMMRDTPMCLSLTGDVGANRTHGTRMKLNSEWESSWESRSFVRDGDDVSVNKSSPMASQKTSTDQVRSASTTTLMPTQWFPRAACCCTPSLCEWSSPHWCANVASALCQHRVTVTGLFPRDSKVQLGQDSHGRPRACHMPLGTTGHGRSPRASTLVWVDTSCCTSQRKLCSRRSTQGWPTLDKWWQSMSSRFRSSEGDGSKTPNCDGSDLWSQADRNRPFGLPSSPLTLLRKNQCSGLPMLASQANPRKAMRKSRLKGSSTTFRTAPFPQVEGSNMMQDAASSNTYWKRRK